MKANQINAGEVFGNFTILKDLGQCPCGKRGRKQRKVLCRCLCGREKEVWYHNLKRELSFSCGKCKPDDQGGKTYNCWRKMIQSCTNPKSDSWKYYGGRGITVCDRWRYSYENFLEDMGERPPNTKLSRIDIYLGYCRVNCRWIDKIVAGTNRRKRLVLTIDGQSKYLTEWSAISGTHHHTIRHRIEIGWSHREAVYGKPKPTLTLGLEIKTISQWSLESGVSERCIIRRLKNGWSSHQAVYGKKLGTKLEALDNQILKIQKGIPTTKPVGV